MTFSLTVLWWQPAAIVTALVLLCWAFWPIEEHGAFAGLGRLFLFVPVALVLLVAWVATAFLK